MKPVDFHSFFEDQEARFAIFSTYEFDPLHFEKYLLYSEALGRARRIIVMVDGGRFQRLLAESNTAARSLNQHYLVVPVRRPGGVFHPKLALLLGQSHAEVICGSNNLTQPGSTHNLELLNRVPVRVDGAREIEHLPLVREAIQFFKDCTAYGETRASRIASKWLGDLEKEFPWLSSIHEGGENEGPVLVHTLHGGLWEWLAAKVGKERPQKIQIISPFYDSDLGLLSRVRERWPDCQVEITAQQNSSNLPADVLGGLPFKSAVEEPTLDGLPLAAAVRSYAMTPLQTEPGTHYQYSNAGINTAARIIEVVAGVKYEDFMQQRLFGPLGMKDTTFWPSEAQARRVAKSYRPDAAKTNLVELPIGQLLYPLSDRTHRFPMPAGGLFSTAQDTALFCRMLLNGGELNGRRYLSESAFRELTKRQTPASVKDSYGLGLAVGSDWFGHGGAHATNMEIRPAQGLVVIWMVQHAGFPGDGAKAQDVFGNWALERFGK